MATTATPKRKRKRVSSSLPEARGLDLLPGGIASAPRVQPPPGELDFTAEKYGIIHGVVLIALDRSRRNGMLFTLAGKKSVVALEVGGRTFAVQNGHVSDSKTEDEGVIFNLYIDSENNLRGSWSLNPHDPLFKKRFYAAKHHPEVMCFSIEANMSDTVIEDTPAGEAAIEFKNVRCFALVKAGGLTTTLSQSDGGDMSAKTAAQLRADYPDAVKEIMEQCACEAAEKQGTLQEDYDKLLAEKAEREEADRIADRRDVILSLWAEEMKGVDITQLPDDENGKLLREQAELDEAAITALIDIEDEEVKKSLAKRAVLVKSAVSVVQSVEPPKSSPDTPKEGPSGLVQQSAGNDRKKQEAGMSVPEFTVGALKI